MKYKKIFFSGIIIISLITISPFNVEARSGCCSSHGGVCGCGCCDGTGLSTTCAPYYPQCGSSGSITTTKPSTITTPKITTYELDGKIYYSKSDYDIAVEEKFEKEHTANIASAFQEILERQPSGAELEQWFDYSRDIIEIKNALLATDEYKNLQFAKEHKGNIRNTFIEIIGKQPTTQQIDELYVVSNNDINVIKDYLVDNKDKYINSVNTNTENVQTKNDIQMPGIINYIFCIIIVIGLILARKKIKNLKLAGSIYWFAIGIILIILYFPWPLYCIPLFIACIYFFLARKKQKKNNNFSNEKEQLNIKEKKYKLIFISSSELISAMYKMKFESEGFNVKLLNNGEDIINIVNKFKPNLIATDILLGDMDNPNTNGYEIIKKLKQDNLTKNIPVIILSNLGQKEDIVKGIKAGADDYYIMAEHKPMDIVNKLLEKIINK